MNGSASMPDWRDRAAYEAIIRLGRMGLAWEVLRRDPAYRQCAAAVVPASRMSRSDCDAFAQWGLHFR